MVKKTKKSHKQWPDVYELAAWWIFMKMDSNPAPTPEQLREWLGEAFRTKPSLLEMHQILYNEYEEFKAEFIAPEIK